jgi:hypothetical protein
MRHHRSDPGSSESTGAPVIGRTAPLRRAAVITAGFAALLLAGTPALASPPDSNAPLQSCLGIATGQRASTLHDVGEHASSFDEPRLGLGNVAFRVFGLDSMGEFGAILAEIDGIDATRCP